MDLRQGLVTSVKFDDGICLLNVTTDRPGVEKRDVPLLKPLSGITHVPKQGDLVAMDKIEGGEYVVVGILNKAPDEQADLGQEEFAITLDENTEVAFQQNENSYDISIDCEGTVQIDCENIVLGSGSEDVVTGIQSTSTNSEGGITDIELSTSENVNVD